MHLSIFASLLALSATALGSCDLKKKATKIGGSAATVTGPFNIKVSATGSVLNGNLGYAVGGGKLVYDVKKGGAGSDFYLNSKGNVILFDGATAYTAYENDPDATGNVILGSSTSSNMKCEVESSCKLSCKVGSNSYQCLASPKDKPDWCIGKSKSSVAQNCVPFSPVVVPK